jgi:hypothetical protein
MLSSESMAAEGLIDEVFFQKKGVEKVREHYS